MALYRWPTDPPGKPAAHTKTWTAHQIERASNRGAPQTTISTTQPPSIKGQGSPAPAAAESADSAPVFDPNAPLPVDPAFDDEQAGIDKTRDTLLGTGTLPGTIKQDRTRGLLEYGFTEDPTNGALAFDPNNPFSKAALLKKSYDTGRARARQTMGSGGQLYSGAFQNQQDLLNRNQLGDEDALTKALGAFLNANTAQTTQAQTNWETDSARAKGARLGRALLNPLYNPLVGGGAAGSGGTTAPAAVAPAAAPAPKKIPALKANVLTAGPGVRSTSGAKATTKRKGKIKTYTTAVKGP